MTRESQGTLISLLQSSANGDEAARGVLWEAVYDSLRGIAGGLMAREQPNHVLDPTALVHEAYVRLVGGAPLEKKNRTYFFGAAAQAMRRILIEHARKHMRGEARIPSFPWESLTVPPVEPSAASVQALDRALDALAGHDPQAHEVVMLKFFAGLTVEKISQSLDISPRTVNRCWTYGRTWLYHRLSDGKS